MADPPSASPAVSELLHAWRRALTGRGVRVALADGEDPRAAEAAITLHAQGVVAPVLIGRASKVRQVAESAGLELPSAIQIADVEE
ncbi:MAG: phosphate acyltransferase, partial [Solirubrobacteraceae bacterium]